MKLNLKQVSVASALLALSSTALADLTQTQVDTAQGTAADTLTGALPTSATTFSSLIFFAYNIDGTFSQVQTLGVRGSNSTSTSAAVFSNAQTNDAGTFLNFSLDNAAGLGANASTLRWGIISFDDAGTPETAPANLNLLSTVNAGSILSGGAQVLPNTAGIIGTGTDLRSFLTNNAGASDSVISTTPGAIDNWTTLNLNTSSLTSTIGAAADASSTLAMYMFSSIADANTTAFSTATAYAGVWTLDALAGTVSYSVNAVPVPAAVWLLLSGLGGLGVVGRRRRALVAA